MIDVKKFKTRTIFKARDNGDLEDKWCVALDIGYSSVKVYSANFVGMFPSYAKKEISSYIGDIDENVIRYKNLDTGECWTVGEDAQQRIDERDAASETALFGRERYMTPMFKVLAETGIAIGCISSEENFINEKEIFVQTGLPPKYLKADKEIFEEVLKGHHHFSLRLGTGKEMKYDFTITEDNINIIAQPMGTLFSVMVGQDRKFVGEAEELFKKNVVVFDPGFGTLDIFPIRSRHLEASETFDNLGMKRVFSDAADAINEKYDQNISISAMQKYLDRGAFRYQKRENGRMITKDIEFADILEEKSKGVCLEALQTLEQVVPLSEYDYLIITGGTSAAWNKIVREYFAGMSTLKIVNGNVNDGLPLAFSNVRGYYMYRYNILAND